MHKSALDKMRVFIEEYLENYSTEQLYILDIGSRVIYPQVSQKPLFKNANWIYKGLDIEGGENVDIVVSDPYDWKELETNSFDVVICNQVFEHISYFWVTTFEIGRVLKEGGLACIIVPSGGGEHKFPMDTFRYYPDGLSVLCGYIGFKNLEVYMQSDNLHYSDGSDFYRDSCLVMKKPIFNDPEREKFMFKNKIHKLLLKDTNVEDLTEVKIDKNIPCKRSCLYKEIPRNAFKNLEIRRKKNITNYFVRKKAIKKCVPILLKAIFGEKVANVIFKVYPKMALWS